MVDIVRKQGAGLPPATKSRWVDMGDGTHALERYTRGSVALESSSGVDIGAVRLIDEVGDAYGVAQIENKPRVSAQPYLYDIAEGKVPDHYPVFHFGHNPDVGISWETVYSSSNLRPYLSGAERLQVASTDANDDGAGTGARTVQIHGRDGNYNILSETVTMVGGGNATTINSFLRVCTITVLTAGSTGSNEGVISVSNNADTIVLQEIAIGNNRSGSASCTVPAGQTMYLTQVMISEASNKGSEFGLFLRPFGGVWAIYQTIVMLDSSIAPPYTMPVAISEKTDIEIRARGILAGANVAAGFSGWREIN